MARFTVIHKIYQKTDYIVEQSMCRCAATINTQHSLGYCSTSPAIQNAAKRPRYDKHASKYRSVKHCFHQYPMNSPSIGWKLKESLGGRADNSRRPSSYFRQKCGAGSRFAWAVCLPFASHLWGVVWLRSSTIPNVFSSLRAACAYCFGTVLEAFRPLLSTSSTSACCKAFPLCASSSRHSSPSYPPPYSVHSLH